MDNPNAGRPRKTTAAKGRREQVVEQVIDAARTLFSTTPIDQVTTRLIAEKAEVNLGLIHRYFGSKDEILRQVMEGYAKTFREDVSAAASLEASFKLLLEDPHQRAFVRTLAYVTMSSTDLDVFVSEAGAIKATVIRAADSTGASDTHSEIEQRQASVLASWAMLFGWLLFKDFLIKASGRVVSSSKTQEIVERALGALLGSTPEKKKRTPRSTSSKIDRDIR